MICSISGEIPKTPIVSKKTGKLYEKHILLKYLEANTNEPNSSEPSDEADFIEINQDAPVVAPRPPTLTSIPSLLSVFQNEWDSVMLESFTLKQQYQQVRQELSQALYQNDAACRVIARIVKERDEARNALQNFQAQLNTQPNAIQTNSGTEMDVDSETADIVENAKNLISETFKSLSSQRKKRKQPAELSTPDDIKAFSLLSQIDSIHSSTKPGILTIAADHTGDYILTGGLDNHGEVYQRSSGKTVATLKGHTKKVTNVAWLNNNTKTLFTGAADKTVRLWNISDDSKEHSWKTSHTFKYHKSAISGLASHPSHSFIVSSSIDGAWHMCDISVGSSVFSGKLDDDLPAVSCQVHPDGLILGTGSSDGKLLIWDLKSQSQLMTFDINLPSNEISGSVSSISFSENGYYLAASNNDIVQIVDLRKKAAIHTIQLSVPGASSENEWESWASSSVVKDLKFDKSGSFLAITGENTRVYKSKSWSELLEVTDNNMEVTGFDWLDNCASGFATCSMDRSLRFYGQAN
ncbi:hypothetical protein BB561_003283 [Smittium simulii]|uniref:Pre-mRNA-processing factor 19 n=1 Tax=Smittium simulii TaxID=133385 RepID=A0A2T9YM90_9FUNG|nr:hypothetical protein BB561_003283 [Smittium simulii]